MTRFYHRALALALSTPLLLIAASAAAQTNTNPVSGWSQASGNAGTAGTVGLNVFHLFMWGIEGVITLVGGKACVGAAMSGQTQQLWPRLMATTIGLSIPPAVNWITGTTG